MDHKKLASRNDSENKQREYYKKPMENLETVALLFARFGDLFGSKCLDRGIVISDRDGTYTKSYMVWCRKLKEIPSEGFARGISKIEHMAIEAGLNGKELWPPSYAEFMGMCMEPKKDRVVPYHRPYLPSPRESKSQRGERIEIAKTHLSKIKDILNDI